MVTVGTLRQQTALADASRPLVLAAEDEESRALIGQFEIVNAYPDMTNERGEFVSTFKIVVRARPAKEE